MSVVGQSISPSIEKVSRITQYFSELHRANVTLVKRASGDVLSDKVN
jgi:hypothetical protein